jgi:membrane protein
LKPQEGQRQTACIRYISTPHRSQRNASSVERRPGFDASGSIFVGLVTGGAGGWTRGDEVAGTVSGRISARSWMRTARLYERVRYNGAARRSHSRVSVHDLASSPPVAPTVTVRTFRRLKRSALVAWRATGRGFVDFYNSENLTFAASIAYYTLLSLFPFLLLILSITSRIAVGESGTSGQTLLQIVVRALPSNFEFLSNQVQEMAAAPLKLGLVSTLITLWASMGVFGAITSAVNHAWGVERNYGFFKHKLIAFLMMMAAGLIMVVALLLIGAVQVIESNWFSGVLARYPQLYEFSGFAYRNAPTPMFILVVGMIYYFVPNAEVRLRDVWYGAIVAGLLWRLTFAGFAWYVRDLSRFNVHGSVAAVVVFLLWVYLSAVIILFGAEITAAFARLRKHLPQEAPAAPARQ